MRARTLMAAAGLGLVLVLDGVAGCTTTNPRMVFDKPGVAPAQRQRDEDECVRKSLTQDTDGSTLALVEIDRDAFARCMQARGYTLRAAR